MKLYGKSKVRVTLEKDKDLILWLFGHSCVRCGRRTNTIHEIVPISHGNSSLHWKNRIPLCITCHDWAHNVGTNISIPDLQMKRRQYLIRKFKLDGKLQEKEDVQENCSDL